MLSSKLRACGSRAFRPANVTIPSRAPASRAGTRTTLYSRPFAPSALSSKTLIPSIVSARQYANGRPHPPGGTHRMNLGGEPEKAALEQFGVDLTAKAKEGKLDPVIGRTAEVHRTIQVLS